MSTAPQNPVRFGVFELDRCTGLLRKNENWFTLADPAGHPFDLCLFPAKQEPTLMGVMLDCPDAKELSTFYAELLGKPVTYEGEGVAMIGEDGAQPVMFQQVTEYHAPRWPDPAYPQQFHAMIMEATTNSLDATRMMSSLHSCSLHAAARRLTACRPWAPRDNRVLSGRADRVGSR